MFIFNKNKNRTLKIKQKHFLKFKNIKNIKNIFKNIKK